jgi:RNA polymerase sigma-70 factor (ECF subfamily)
MVDADALRGWGWGVVHIAVDADADDLPPLDPAAETIAAAQAGDPEAFAALYRRTVDQVYRYVYWRCGADRALAEDLTQETYYRALRRLDTYRPQPGAGFVGWLVSIAHNLTVDHHRSAAARREAPTAAVADGAVTSAAEEALEQEDTVRAVRQGLLALKTAHREVLVLRFVHDLPLADTAAVMGRPVSAIKMLQHRALLSLAAKLGPR